MQGPDGGTSGNPGCFLNVVPKERILFTSMLTAGWRPNTPWLGFTANTIAEEGAGSRYIADLATREQHEH
jgi:uncharacterized protein YndB with AHSA1/START domain